ncbi:unnamed protein product [Chondrus crispus]|uniref:Uncharacterized protein n=1 Tax=Chondrus crispus TaxID=2769 RepID=R7QJD5_CHOCR|nr:unnamed protein product [Chondrus crispus]CDF38214.1 unnamed protein product [Chondrus crispus]|eukprot:XP_005718099.1 unnamed protein product [Chondrus crispus]
MHDSKIYITSDVVDQVNPGAMRQPLVSYHSISRAQEGSLRIPNIEPLCSESAHDVIRRSLRSLPRKLYIIHASQVQFLPSTDHFYVREEDVTYRCYDFPHRRVSNQVRP